MQRRWHPMLIALLIIGPAFGEGFDRDPGWEGYRNRLMTGQGPITRQHFGYRPTRKAAGKKEGEIGGWIQRSVVPAWYAKPIATKTLADKLSASGRFAVHSDNSNTGTMVGWFNSEQSRGWRTPHSLVMRIDGNGGKFWVFFEYGTADWNTGGRGCFEGEAYQTTKTRPFRADGTPHDWSMTYDPAGAGGNGLVTFVLDGTSYDLELASGHKAVGATFDRFGVFNQQSGGDGMDVFFDDFVLDGEPVSLDADPNWEAKGNEVEFEDRARRPLHDFGFTPTRFAGGAAGGEIGGILWRDEAPAYYGAKIDALNLNDSFAASGRLAFTGAGSDSAAYVGWFDSASKRGNAAAKDDRVRKNMLAVMIEGPSRVGHYFRPAYRCWDGEGTFPDDGPVIRPDGKVHDWAIRYDPAGNGRIAVTLDGREQVLDLRPGDKARGATFDRFGIFNHQAGGNYVYLYVDDVSFTSRR